MVKALQKMSRQIDLLKQMGLGSFLAYRLAQRGAKVRITLAGETLTIRAGSGELTEVHEVPAEVTSYGTVLVDAAFFSRVIATMPGPTIRLEHGSGSLGLTSGASTFRLPTGALDDYPPAPRVDG